MEVVNLESVVDGLHSVGPSWEKKSALADEAGCIDPENRVAEFAAAGADAISFHPEATKQPAAVCQRIRDAGVAPGIVLNPGTAVASVAPLLDMVDIAVVMLVSPGYGGPKYTELALEKVKALRALRPDLHISVDGGVNAKLAPELLRAGANVLVAGGAIFKADDKASVVAELIGNAPHKLQNIPGGLDAHSGPAGAASPFEDDACPDA